MLSLADSVGWEGRLESQDSTDLLQRVAELYGATHLLVMTLQADRLEGRLPCRPR